MSLSPATMNRGQLYTLANEGKRHQTYDDATGESIGADGLGVNTKARLQGTLTIGIGHTGQDFKPGDVWADDKIFAVYDDDYHRAVTEAYAICRNGTWNRLGETRQAALTDMCFSMGGQGVAQFTLLLRAITISDWEGAAREVMASKYATQAPTRALRNSLMFKNGEWQ